MNGREVRQPWRSPANAMALTPSPRRGQSPGLSSAQAAQHDCDAIAPGSLGRSPDAPHPLTTLGNSDDTLRVHDNESHFQ